MSYSRSLKSIAARFTAPAGFLLLATVPLACGDPPSVDKKAADEQPADTKAADSKPAGGAPSVPVPGVTDTEIKIGAHTVLTGPVAIYGTINAAAKAYFDQVNAEGGINGRKINYVIEDDGLNPVKTVEVTKKLVEQDNIFAMFLPIGPTHLAVAEYLSDKGIPDFSIGDGGEALIVPFKRNRFFGGVTYKGEGERLAKWVQERNPGKKIAFLGQNDTFGDDALAGVKAGLKDPALLVEAAAYDRMTQNANTQVLKLKKAKADIVIAFATPTALTSAMKFAAQNGFKAQWYTSGVNGTDFIVQMGGEKVMEGVAALASGVPESDTSNPAVIKHIALLKERVPGLSMSAFTMWAQSNAEVFVEVLKRAGKDLTRETFLKAAEGMSSWAGCTLCATPVTLSNTDHALFDAETLVPFEVKGGHWVRMK